MELLSLIILLVLLVFYLTDRSDHKSSTTRLIEAIRYLNKELQQLKEEVSGLRSKDLPALQETLRPAPTSQPVPPAPEPAPIPVPAPAQEHSIWAPKPAPPAPEPEPAPMDVPVPAEDHSTWAPKPAPPAPEPEPMDVPAAASPAVPVPPEIPAQQPQPADPRPSIDPAPPPITPPQEREDRGPAPPPYESRSTRWSRNNPDLEKFIGENLINKIGIAILVLGIAFFVKYAIDKDWIKEGGRVAIGLLCGAILVGLAHYLRKGYRAFSSVLAGGGIAVFYFTIAFAFHQYAMLSQAAAFISMVVITGFAVALAVLYDKIELAVIAAIGGFLTPFLVSTGDGNYVALFTYLVILNAGLLALAWFRRWPLVNVLSLFFTVVIYGAWLGQLVVRISNHHPAAAAVSFPLALLFATLLYALFMGMNILHQVRRAQVFKAFDFFLLLLITLCYFSAGMTLLHYQAGGRFQGLFTVAIAAPNLALAWYFFKRKKTDPNLLYLFIGLTLSFLTLAVPVQLHGHAITLFWSAEFVVLLWLYQRSGIRLFQYASAIVMVCAMVSLLMDWNAAATQSDGHLRLLFIGARGIVTNLTAAAAFAAFAVLRKDSDKPFLDFDARLSFRVAALISAGLLYLTCIFSVNLALKGLDSYAVPNAYYRIITGLYLLAGTAWLKQRRHPATPVARISAAAICFLLYLFSIPLITGLRDGVLGGRYAMGHFVAHWAGNALLLYLFAGAIRVMRRGGEAARSLTIGLTWGISLALVIFLSVEAGHLYILAGYKPGAVPVLQRQYSKAVLTILWGLSSFVLMWLGMRHRNKTLRIISLSLFSLALLKLFLLDIRGISEGGKIAAFVLLGVLLLTVSFMYQKLKKILSDDRGE